jgi:hypothetical protein
MALSQIGRVHGTASAGAFYGIQPLAVRVTDSSSNFTADSVDGTTGVITEGGYSKMVRAIQTLGSVVILGTQANGAFCAVVDGASFNAGGDATNTGWGGILKTLATAVADDIGTPGTIAVTSGTVFTSAGVFTIA